MNSKIYRCGWCGCFTNKNGQVLELVMFKKADRIVEKYGDIKTVRVTGECCYNEQKGKPMVQVTRDMAIDAGDRSLEGTWIEW